MGTALELDVRLGALQDLVATLNDGPARLAAAAVQTLKNTIRWAEARAVWRVSAPGGYRSPVEGRLHRRTGYLAKAIGSRFEGSLANDGTVDFSGSIGTYNAPDGADPIYFAVQEFGVAGEITPRNAKVLTLPLDEALTDTGAPRFSARDLMVPGNTPYEDSFWAKSKKGTLLLFGERDDGDIVPLFVGLTSVKGPQGVRYLGKSAEEAVPLFHANLQKWWVQAMLAQHRQLPPETRG